MSRSTLLSLYPLFLVIYEFAVYIGNDMIMPGMPLVVKEFGTSDSYVATSLTAYLLGGAALQLFLGPISDRWGRRPILLSGVLFFLLSTLAVSMTNTIESFIVARFLQGIGLAFIGVVGYATLHEYYEESAAVRLTSLMGAVTLLAPLAGPVAGSFYISFFSWRSIFYSIAAVAALAFVGLMFTMPETVTRPESLDVKSVAKKYRSLLFSRSFVGGSLALALLGTPLLGWIAMSPLMLFEKAGFSQLQYSLTQVPVFCSMMAGNFFLALLSQTVDLSIIIKWSFWLAGIGLLGTFLLPFFVGDNPWTFVLPFCVYAFGLGIYWAPMTRRILFATDIAKGTASAAMMVLSYALQGLLVGILPLMYQSQNNAILGGAFVAMFIAALGCQADKEKRPC